jgi:hypothetical protein
LSSQQLREPLLPPHTPGKEHSYHGVRATREQVSDEDPQQRSDIRQLARRRRAANRWPTWGTAYPHNPIPDPGTWVGGLLFLPPLCRRPRIRTETGSIHLYLRFIGANSMTELDASRSWLKSPRPRPGGQSPRGVFPAGDVFAGTAGFSADSMEEASWNCALRVEVSRGRICPETSKLPNLNANAIHVPKRRLSANAKST